MLIGIFLLIAFSSFLVNFFNARYITHLANNNRLAAAINGELVQLAGAGVVFNYVHNFWYVVPMILGGFCGTFYYKRGQPSP